MQSKLVAILGNLPTGLVSQFRPGTSGLYLVMLFVVCCVFAVRLEVKSVVITTKTKLMDHDLATSTNKAGFK